MSAALGNQSQKLLKRRALINTGVGSSRDATVKTWKPLVFFYKELQPTDDSYWFSLQHRRRGHEEARASTLKLTISNLSQDNKARPLEIQAYLDVEGLGPSERRLHLDKDKVDKEYIGRILSEAVRIVKRELNRRVVLPKVVWQILGETLEKLVNIDQWVMWKVKMRRIVEKSPRFLTFTRTKDDHPLVSSSVCET
jgi:hypothetical protein